MKYLLKERKNYFVEKKKTVIENKNKEVFIEPAWSIMVKPKQVRVSGH